MEMDAFASLHTILLVGIPTVEAMGGCLLLTKGVQISCAVEEACAHGPVFRVIIASCVVQVGGTSVPLSLIIQRTTSSCDDVSLLSGFFP